MDLHLTPADLVRVRRAFTALLSPLEHPSIGEWAVAVLHVTRLALNADRAMLYLPEQDSDPQTLRMWQDGGNGEDKTPLQVPRDAATRGRRSREGVGRQTEDQAKLYERREPDQTEISMRSEGEGGVHATLSVQFDRSEPPLFVARPVALLNLLRPAFLAGVSLALQSTRMRGVLPQMLDDLGAPLALFDATGRVMHQTAALTQLLLDNADAGRLHAFIASAAATTTGRRAGGFTARERPISPLVQQVSTHDGDYSIHAVSVSAVFAGTNAAVLVLLSRLRAEPLSDGALRERFQLTPREIQVAHLLSEGRANGDIATRLKISPRTAEHHTQRVLGKLDARSRSQAAVRLRGE